MSTGVNNDHGVQFEDEEPHVLPIQNNQIELEPEFQKEEQKEKQKDEQFENQQKEIQMVLDLKEHISPRKTKLNNKHRNIPDIKDTWYKTYRDVVLTCYFISKQDPQRAYNWPNDSYEIIRPWYESMLKHDLHGIIFYDKLSEEFIEKYTTEKIKFKKCKLGHYSTNDERFILYYMYLLENQYQHILMTDVSDVIINKNPFPFIKDPQNNNNGQRIFIGRDCMNYVDGSKGCRKMVKKIKKKRPKTPYFDYTKKERTTLPMYNPGLVGGRYEVIVKFLSRMVKIFFRINLQVNFNLLFSNFVLHKKYMEGFDQNKFKPELEHSYHEEIGDSCTDLIYSGAPFNSQFKRYEKEDESSAYLLHK